MDAMKFQNHFPDILITINFPSGSTADVTFVSRNPERVRWNKSTDIFYKDNYERAREISITID